MGRQRPDQALTSEAISQLSRLSMYQVCKLVADCPYALKDGIIHKRSGTGRVPQEEAGHGWSRLLCPLPSLMLAPGTPLSGVSGGCLHFCWTKRARSDSDQGLRMGNCTVLVLHVLSVHMLGLGLGYLPVPVHAVGNDAMIHWGHESL